MNERMIPLKDVLDLIEKYYIRTDSNWWNEFKEDLLSKQSPDKNKD